MDSPAPRGGRYPCSLVSLLVGLYLQTGASLRCSASAFGVFVRHFRLDLPVPSFTTIRSWVLRLGCHALVRPLPQDVPWLWIIDHTIQIGDKKLFLVVGCPLSEVPFGQRCLSLADLHLVALVPMAKSDQYLVEAELEKAARRTAAPRLIVSDQGSDLVKGIERFQRHHAGTVAVGDIAHHGANVLENRWERDPRWQEFLRQLAQTNQRIRQTADAILLSPTMRNKARFMNVGPVLRFARLVLALLKRPSVDERVQGRYGWLLGYEGDLAGWLEQHGLVEKTNGRRMAARAGSGDAGGAGEGVGSGERAAGDEDGEGAPARLGVEERAPGEGRGDAGGQQRGAGIGVRQAEGEGGGERQGGADGDGDVVGRDPGWAG